MRNYEWYSPLSGCAISQRLSTLDNLTHLCLEHELLVTSAKHEDSYSRNFFELPNSNHGVRRHCTAELWANSLDC